MEFLIDITKFLVDLFAGGRSFVRVYLFIFYALSLAIFSIFLVKGRFVGLYNILSKLGYRCLVLSLFISFSITFILQIHLITKVGFDSYLSTGIMFNNGEISSSSILHNHIGKGTISHLLGFFGVQSAIDGMDIGYAYRGVINNQIYLLMSVFFLIALLTFVSNFIIILKVIKYRKDKLIFFLCYSIFSFSILKNLFDGGLLNYEVLPTLIGLYVLNIWYSSDNSSKEKAVRIFWIYTFILVVVIIVKLAGDNFLLLSKSQMYIRGFIGTSGLTLFLLSFIIRIKNPKNKVLIFTIFISSITIVLGSKIDYFNYKYLKLSSFDEYYVFSKNIKTDMQIEGYESSLSNIGNLNIYRSQGDSNTRLFELADTVGVPLNYYPVMIPGYNCNPMQPKENMQFKLKDLGESDNVTSMYKEFSLKQLKEIINDSNIFALNDFSLYSSSDNVYNVSIYFNDCASRKVDIIEGIINDIGIDSFYIYDIKNSSIIHNLD